MKWSPIFFENGESMSLNPLLDRLAAFTPTEFPVISLYLNAQADQHGHDHFKPFVRKELYTRAKTYPLHSPERESLDRDIERINTYVQEELRPSANGLALFACAGANNFFEAVQLEAPIAEHQLYVAHQPYLYPLARVIDQYPRYAALLADTNTARLFVFGLGESLDKETVRNPKVSRPSVGGWAQMRYQRHVENFHLHHAKEVVEVLDRAVREDKVKYIVLAGDEVIIPVLREQLPPALHEKVIDVLHLDMITPEHEVLHATLEAMREQDAKDDAEKVARMLDAYRAGGLGVVGVRNTLAALTNGQVDELILSATPETIHENGEDDAPQVAGTPAARSSSGEASTNVADELVTRARQTSARVTFIEDPALLANVGGVGALLRYRL